MKLRTRKSRTMLFASCITIMLCGSLVGIGFVLRNWNRESVNLTTAVHVTNEFLENIHTGDVESAYLMLSEKFSPHISIDQFSELVEQDKDIFSTYQNLDICDWGVFVNDGYIIDTSGLIYFEGGTIVVQISIHKDADAVWRIQGFRFRPDIDPVPFGLCQ